MAQVRRAGAASFSKNKSEKLSDVIPGCVQVFVCELLFFLTFHFVFPEKSAHSQAACVISSLGGSFNDRINRSFLLRFYLMGFLLSWFYQLLMTADERRAARRETFSAPVTKLGAT